MFEWNISKSNLCELSNKWNNFSVEEMRSTRATYVNMISNHDIQNTEQEIDFVNVDNMSKHTLKAPNRLK